MQINRQQVRIQLEVRLSDAITIYEWSEKGLTKQVGETTEILNKTPSVVSWSVSSSEQERSSSCEVSVYDSELKITSLLLAKLKADGGFLVPPNLFEEPEAAPTTPGTSTTGGDLSSVQEGLTGDALYSVIVGYAKSIGITDLGHLAAILGTAEIESSGGIYLEEIDDGSGYSYLGADAAWHGRGLVQTTFQSNYEKVGGFLGYDFIADPDGLTRLEWAIPALVRGMNEGWYTGSKLADFGSGANYDYDGSRDIVNPGEGGTRRANYVSYSKQFYTRLSNGELQNTAITAPTTTEVLKDVAAVTAGGTVADTLGVPVTGEAANTLQAGLAAQTITDIGTQIVQETKNASEQAEFAKDLSEVSAEATKFSTLYVYVKYTNSDEIKYTYVWTDINTADRQTLTLSGRSIDALIEASTGGTELVQTYGNTSLRQFAQIIANELGLLLELEETELSEKNIELINQFKGESKYTVLGRIARQSGYFLRNDGAKLILKPLLNANSEASYTLKPEKYIKFPKFSESASADRVTSKGLPPIVQGLTKANRAATATTPGTPTTNPVDAIIRVFVDGNDDATGFIIDSKGTFLTNEHVSDGATGDVELKNGSKLKVTFEKVDKAQDIAIGKLPASNNAYPYIDLSSNVTVIVGDTLTAIGMAQSKDPWYTSTGKVLSLTAASNVPTATIATTANFIEPGNSGCPIFNTDGKLIGMAQARQETTGEGRVIPVSTLIAFTAGLIGVTGGIAAPTTAAPTTPKPVSPFEFQRPTAQTGLATALEILKPVTDTDSSSVKSASASTAKVTADNEAAAKEYVSNVSSEYDIGEGFKLTIEYLTDIETLQLAPGTIILVPPVSYQSGIFDEYRLKLVTHKNGNRSTLNLYKPVYVKKKSKVTETPLSTGGAVFNGKTQGTISAAPELENLTSLQFVNPIPTGVVTSYYGFRMHPIQGRRIRHNGTDYGAPKGDPILAAAAGVVAYADGGDNGSGYGNVVILYHGTVASKKVFSMYGHNDSVSCATGEIVQQGDEIAKCGTTGQSTGDHLHFATTVGHDWGLNDAFNYPDNTSSVWAHPEKNFINKAFTGEVDPIGQTDDGSV